MIQVVETDMPVGVKASPCSASFDHLLRKQSHSVRVKKQVSTLHHKFADTLLSSKFDGICVNMRSSRV